MNDKTDKWLKAATRDQLEELLRDLIRISLEAGVLVYQKTN